MGACWVLRSCVHTSFCRSIDRPIAFCPLLSLSLSLSLSVCVCVCVCASGRSLLARDLTDRHQEDLLKDTWVWVWVCCCWTMSLLFALVGGLLRRGEGPPIKAVPSWMC